jgi:hypothetical protein
MSFKGSVEERQTEVGLLISPFKVFGLFDELMWDHFPAVCNSLHTLIIVKVTLMLMMFEKFCLCPRDEFVLRSSCNWEVLFHVSQAPNGQLLRMSLEVLIIEVSYRALISCPIKSVRVSLTCCDKSEVNLFLLICYFLLLWFIGEEKFKLILWDLRLIKLLFKYALCLHFEAFGSEIGW